MVTKTKMVDSKNADAELPNRNEKATASDSYTNQNGMATRFTSEVVRSGEEGGYH